MGIKIAEQIEIIKRMVNEKFKIYLGEGLIADFQCKFNPPATIEEINQLEKDHKIAIPPDYKEFLLITNGMYLMDIMKFHSLNDIEMILDTGIYMQGVYPIAYINGDYIVINSDDIVCRQYIYAGGHDTVDEFICLSASFETFLDRLTSTNCNIYWDWYHSKIFYSFSGNYPDTKPTRYTSPVIYTKASLVVPNPPDNK
ncbi:MAG: SMI1/KNR4 family protein [Bacillota bacterium]|nr:SMI1/KNR4 family protein [Bacillota bacterium]